MPFIRYRIGDVGMLSDEVCPCGNGLPILAELLGRTTATFRTRMGTLIHGGYFTQTVLPGQRCEPVPNNPRDP